MISIVRDHIFTVEEREKFVNNLKATPSEYQSNSYSIIYNSTIISTTLSSALTKTSSRTISASTIKTITTTTSTKTTTTTTLTTVNWDSNNFTNIKTLRGHIQVVSCILVLKNGLIVSGDWKNDILIWNVNFSLEKEINNGWTKYGVSTIEEINDGYLLTASGDKTIKKWNSTYHLIDSVNSLNYVIYSLLYINASRVVVGGTEGILHILNTNDLHTKFNFSGEGHTKTVNKIILLFSGNLATASEDKTIRVWNLNTMSLLFKLKGHNDSVLAMVQLKNGNLATGSLDKSIIVWDIIKKSIIYTLNNHTDAVSSLILLKNGDLVSGSWDHTIVIWDMSKKSVKQILKGHQAGIFPMVQLNNGDFLTGSWDCMIKIWSRRKSL